MHAAHHACMQCAGACVSTHCCAEPAAASVRSSHSQNFTSWSADALRKPLLSGSATNDHTWRPVRSTPPQRHSHPHPVPFSRRFHSVVQSRPCACNQGEHAAAAGDPKQARTGPWCASSVSSTADAPMSRICSVPSLVPTTAWRLPGANSAHRPCAQQVSAASAPRQFLHFARDISQCTTL